MFWLKQNFIFIHFFSTTIKKSLVSIGSYGVIFIYSFT